jgi:hypothetical protein
MINVNAGNDPEAFFDESVGHASYATKEVDDRN